ncbi:bactofilin family protein [Caulobacter hibisci]|uniref:Polymer-forming cytoskeletal protein n=1 Tax=Caulobacter hibisci TaxID=2035993 RepID=A0ABS0SRW2_9CAUL|nr:polymer-forming cytoskeletal protein [Caulobacter hibisci]MBI1682241.1 polymer-forming cytoskeletal protein [Caulobacter hibisci]
MFQKKKDVPASLSLEPLATAPIQVQLQPQPAPPPPRPKPASLIAQGLTIRGDVSGDGELHLDCVVIGDIKVGKLVLGPNGSVEGSIAAQAIEIHGKVKGTVAARAVRLYGTAKVDGDIAHEQLAMETGADFQGRSVKFTRPAPQPAPAPAPVAPAPVASAPADYAPVAG